MMRVLNNFKTDGFNLNTKFGILSGQDTRFFPERLTGSKGKGFLMQKLVYEFNKDFLIKKVTGLKKDYRDRTFVFALPFSC